MDYGQLLGDVEELDFVDNRKSADALIKAVLGLLVSSLDEGSARELVEKLPDPLTWDILRREKRNTSIDSMQFFGEIGNQFHLDGDDVETLVDMILQEVKLDLSDELRSKLEAAAPEDLGQLIRSAG